MLGRVYGAVVAVSRSGGSDCESVSGGLLSQPVAALSSASFFVAAGWLWLRRPAGAGRVPASVYAVLVGLVGFGSLMYHGPRGSAAELVHDASIVVVVATAVGVPVSRLLRGRRAFAPGASRMAVVACVAAVFGVTAQLLGRTGAPLCDPDSLLQLHALWHGMMAVALAAWGAALWSPARVREAAVSG